MADFNIRSDSVDVEQIMEQIRARIREMRGVDYTEQEIRELAAVKLEKFLDPRGVRSDLLDQFRKAQPPDAPLDLPNYAFESTTLFDSHRAIVRFIRRLRRDLVERGRSVDSIVRQYEESVRPMHMQFVEPTKRYADLIIPEGGHNQVAIDLLKTKIRELLRERGVAPVASAGF